MKHNIYSSQQSPARTSNFSNAGDHNKFASSSCSGLTFRRNSPLRRLLAWLREELAPSNPAMPDRQATPAQFATLTAILAVGAVAAVYSLGFA